MTGAAVLLGVLMIVSPEMAVQPISAANGRLLQNAGAASPLTNQITQLPYYSTTYPSNRTAIVKLVESHYNTTYQLIQGAYPGVCGFQPNGFSLIDENFFVGHALQEYNPSMGNTILSSVASYLARVNYTNNDRREVLFGNNIFLPPLATTQVTVAGVTPTCPNGGNNKTSFFITTEIPLNQPLKSYTKAVGYMVVVGLEDYLQRNVSGAQAIFNTLLNWFVFNGTYKGFLSPAQMPCPPSNPNCASGNVFNTRDLAYFLFFARATRFDQEVPPTTLSEIESTLWNQQLPQYDGGLATTYSYNGSPLPKGGHTSNEINGLALLVYDPRIQTTWFPGAIQTLPTNSSVSCSSSSLLVNTPTTCEAMVSNNDTSISLPPTGQVDFGSSGSGSFSNSATCTLAKVAPATGGCSVTFTPGPGGEGNQNISASYPGDTYHSGSAGNGSLSVTQRSSSLSLTCSPSQVRAGSKVKCTVIVKDSTTAGTAILPQGSVSFSASKQVKFNSLSCNLSSSAPGQGSCSITFTPGNKAIGTVTVSASFGGDQDHTASTGHTSVRVR